MKRIFVINGSASKSSSNERLIENFVNRIKEDFEIETYTDLKQIPHFDPELTIENTPVAVVDFRRKIEDADAVLICTPEYVFSIPSGLKNAIEWCVSTTIFSDKLVGIITASASGEKGHDELQLIMKTVGATIKSQTTLLIKGIKGKINGDGEITDAETELAFANFIKLFKNSLAYKT